MRFHSRVVRCLACVLGSVSLVSMMASLFKLLQIQSGAHPPTRICALPPHLVAALMMPSLRLLGPSGGFVGWLAGCAFFGQCHRAFCPVVDLLLYSVASEVAHYLRCVFSGALHGDSFVRSFCRSASRYFLIPVPWYNTLYDDDRH